MATTTPSTPLRNLRDVQWDDALTGVTNALVSAQTLNGILDMLEGRAASEPPIGREHETLEVFVEAVVLLGRDALDGIECGARQTRDRLEQLQAAEAVTR